VLNNLLFSDFYGDTTINTIISTFLLECPSRQGKSNAWKDPVTFASVIATYCAGLNFQEKLRYLSSDLGQQQ
jgi:hypothetical protein